MYVVARALKSKTSEEVIENLKYIYLDVGLPNIIQHDQGREFTSKVGRFDHYNTMLRAQNGWNECL